MLPFIYIIMKIKVFLNILIACLTDRKTQHLNEILHIDKLIHNPVKYVIQILKQTIFFREISYYHAGFFCHIQ